MSTKFLSPGWRMPRNANQSKQASYSLHFTPGGVTNVNLGDALSFFIGSFSASMWVKSPDNGKEFFSRYISANGVGNFRIGCGANSGATANTVSLMTKNFLLSGSTDIRDGNWHHVCVTMDAISSTQYTRTIYVDGSQDAQDTVTLATYVSTSSSYGLNLGCNFQNNGHTLVDMSEVSIFDYALSPSQVTTLYGDSTNGVGNPMALSSPPIAYYPLGTSAYNGEYLAENNAIGDYVFNFTGNKTVGLQDLNLGFNSTISYWVKNTSNTGNYMTNNGGTLINTGPYAGNEYYTFKPNNSAPTPNSASLTNSNINTYILSTDWVHWTAVRNGTGYELYANGQSIATATVANWSGYDTIVSGLGQNSLGMQGDGSNFLFWNTNLSSTEVETLYNYGSPIQTLANIPQNSNLKAWYKLDASEVYNSSTTEWTINDATANYKTALDFTGDGNHAGVQVASNLMSGYTDFTWSIWLNPKAFASVEYIMKAAGQTYLRHAFGNINFVVNIAGNVAGSLNVATFDTNKWSHIVALIDQSNSKIKLFVNGVLKGAGTISATGAVGSSSPFAIGTDDSLTQYPWNGLLSNTQVWNTTLTDGGASTVGDIAGGEIATLYNGGSPLTSSIPQSSNNKLWLKMDNLTTGIQDSSGNSNNGTASSEIVQVDSFVSTLNGESLGMSQANLVQSDLQTVAPYSKYAMNFDSASSDYIDCGDSDSLSFGNGTTDSPFSVSTWVYFNSASTSAGIIAKYAGTNATKEWMIYTSPQNFRLLIQDEAYNNFATATSTTIQTNQWYNIITTYDGRGGANANQGINIYVNGQLQTLSYTGSSSYVAMHNTNAAVRIGRYGTGNYFDGTISNASIWNAALTSAQVTEIYNEGLPSNLNSHSAYSNLVSWWQLGENSSFATNWICADEKGSNNGDGQNMGVDALTNGVGTTANGVSASMGVESLIGDAPYSTANALSTNMVITSRVTGSGNTP